MTRDNARRLYLSVSTGLEDPRSEFIFGLFESWICRFSPSSTVLFDFFPRYFKHPTNDVAFAHAILHMAPWLASCFPFSLSSIPSPIACFLPFATNFHDL